MTSRPSGDKYGTLNERHMNKCELYTNKFELVNVKSETESFSLSFQSTKPESKLCII